MSGPLSEYFLKGNCVIVMSDEAVYPDLKSRIHQNWALVGKHQHILDSTFLNL